jgi:hypothetical protein
MSKIVYVCLRDLAKTAETSRVIQAACDRLVPDNIAKVPSRVSGSDGICIGISNPNSLVRVSGYSVAVGHLIDAKDWDQPLSKCPDGAYALFRGNGTVVELVSDTLASRTVWHVMTDDFFAAATSQRALVMLLRSFEFNPQVVPWMLATGTTGPGESWDRRIRCLSGASRVMLDRNSWTLEERAEPARFQPSDASPKDHQEHIVAALRRTVSAVDIANPELAITLSGGVDCRTILSLLPSTQGVRAVTWGLRASLDQPTNDASVARRLATHFGLKHQYFETDLPDEPVERILDRFVANGEGRIDHISGYVDGFALWNKLTRASVRGIIRGDQAFGRKKVHSPSEVRTSAEMPLWTDHSGLPPLEHFGLPDQSVPEQLLRQVGESLETWRDRLQQEYRIPYVLGALSDLKLPYVEIVNPLLANSVVALIRLLPDDLRTDKALLKAIARSIGPSIPFAMDIATQPGDDVLRSPRLVEFLRDYLSDANEESAVPKAFAAFAIDGLTEDRTESRIPISRRARTAIKAWLPAWARRLRNPKPTPARPSQNRFAFRAFLASRAHGLYTDDARALNRL